MHSPSVLHPFDPHHTFPSSFQKVLPMNSRRTFQPCLTKMKLFPLVNTQQTDSCLPLGLALLPQQHSTRGFYNESSKPMTDRRDHESLRPLSLSRESPGQASIVSLATAVYKAVCIALQAPKWLLPSTSSFPGSRGAVRFSFLRVW